LLSDVTSSLYKANCNEFHNKMAFVVILPWLPKTMVAPVCTACAGGPLADFPHHSLTTPAEVSAFFSFRALSPQLSTGANFCALVWFKS
jgi:hypothetical protein